MDLAKEADLQVKVVGDATVVQFESGLIRDEKKLYGALESLNRHATSKSGLKLILDLTNIEYFSSCGLGLLVSLLKKLRSGGGVLKFCCVSEKISNLFKIMHLTTVFEIHEDQPTALAELGVVEA